MTSTATMKRERAEVTLHQRVLVAAPSGGDAEILCRILSEAGIAATSCTNSEDLCRQMQCEAAAAILAEEFLTEEAQRQLIDTLHRQPDWSDFPLIVVGAAGRSQQRGWEALEGIRGHAHAIRLQRPLRKVTLVSSVRAALQSRLRQYQVRDELIHRQRAESALRQSEEQYRRLVGLMPAAVYTCDASGVITFYNEEAARLWGRAPSTGITDERFCGSFRLWLPDGTLLPHDRTPMAVALREGREFRAQSVTIERPDGSRIHVLVNIDPIRDAQGRVVGAINAFHDTTALMQTQHALRQSEERFRELANNIDQLVWTCDELGSATWYSQRWYEYTGTTFDQMQGWGWQKVHHPDHVDRVVERIRRAFETEEPWEDAFPLRGKDGTYRWFLSRAQPIRDAEGNVIRWLGTNTDVTQQRQTQEALRESEERFSQFMQNLPGLAWIKDLEGRYVFANAAAQAAFQVSGEALYGKKDQDIFTADVASRFRTNDREALANETGVQVIETLPDAENRSRYSIVSKFPIPGPDGRAVLVGGVAIDITERKEAEAALKAKEAELELIAGTTPLMLTRCSRDLRYRFVNRAAAALFGCSPEDIVGRLVQDVLGEPAFAVVRPFVERVLRGEPVEFEVELPHTVAGPRWMHVNYAPERDQEGEVQGWIASIVDITDRKRAEAALRDADRRKDEFLALLAHELRNPLAPIRTGLEVLKIAQGDQETIDEVRDTMERQTRQLVTLVDDLLDVSRITCGKFELRKCRVLLADVVQSAVEASRPLMDEAHHRFELQLPHRPVFLEADPNRLAQVISNLLNNAAKYTPEGGEIRLSAQREEDHVVVSVTDTGIGIPEGERDRIFEMFAQVDRPQEKAYPGLGMGLTLVKSLVEMHSGSVEVLSKGGSQGSTFRVRLPILPERRIDDAQHAPASQGQLAVRTHRVLIADDNSAAATMLSMVVRMLGHDVRTAADGEQAVDIAASFRPHVVLMDLGMPKMDGYEAARQIRRQPWGRRVTLIALTGWGQMEDKQRTSDCGFDHHLVKPAEPAELEQLLARVQNDAEAL
jgi:PAS domain S-box-containing protein